MAYTYTILYHLMPPICGHTGDWLCGSHDPQSRICEAPFVRLGLALEWPYGPETPLACWKFMSMRSDMMPSWAEICRNDWHDDWNPGKPCEIQCSCIIYIHLSGSVWDLPSEYIHQKYKKSSQITPFEFGDMAFFLGGPTAQASPRPESGPGYWDLEDELGFSTATAGFQCPKGRWIPQLWTITL